MAFGQDTQLDQIDRKIELIESDTSLKKLESNIKIKPGVTTGSQEIFRVWKWKKSVKKIEQKIKYLEYVSRTIIYLENGIPLKIIETEENYNHSSEKLDYSNPSKVFFAVIYVFDWENDKSKIIRNGERVYTEGTCSSFDYEPLIENAQNIAKSKFK